MITILARAVTYAVLFIGLVLVFLPAQVLSVSGITPPAARGLAQLAGFVVSAMGGLLAVWCVFTFAIVGKGTPAPFDPPRRLVARGPYRKMRNPMYGGAGLALAGAALYYESWALGGYATRFVLATHLLVVWYEEPRLKRTFGAEYEAYLNRVPRWWPTPTWERMIKTHPPRLRPFAAIAALIGWGALILQFYLLLRLTIADGRGVSGGIVAYFGYFTILTNILTALALSAPLVLHDSSLGRFFSRPGANSAVAAAIALVGVAYSLLLRHIWDPQGWQLVADVALHDVMPVLFLIYWWFAVPGRAVRWTHIPRWCIYPVGYILYALVRGALIGHYPYPFMDVGALGYGRVLVNALGLLLAFTLIGVLLVGAGALKKNSLPSPERL